MFTSLSALVHSFAAQLQAPRIVPCSAPRKHPCVKSDREIHFNLRWRLSHTIIDENDIRNGIKIFSPLKYFLSRYVCHELMEFLNQDRSPLCNTRPPLMLEPGIQRHLSHFSMITHGFGSPAIVAALGAVQNYVKESLRYMDKVYPGPGDKTSDYIGSKSLFMHCDTRK